MQIPPVRYTRAKDGARLAYVAFGEGPSLLVTPHGSLSMQYELTEGASYFGALAERFQVVFFDRRGMGLSAPGVEDFSDDVDVSDLAQVADASGLERFVLFGSCMMSPASVMFAAQNPGRVRGLATWAPVSLGSRAVLPAVQDAFLGMLEAHPAMYARTFASNWAPTADGATLERLARAVRDQDQHQSALRLKQTWATDLRAVLPRVPMPTLAFQRRDRVIPQSEPAEVAAAVQQGQMRILNGNDHWQWLGDWAEVVAALETFVDGLSQGPSVSAAEGAIQTILFTDLESSTALTQTVGDDAAQEIVRGHNVTVRKALEAHGGREVKHTGDGIMAAFPSAVRAVEAALQVQRDLAGGEVRVRMGLNAGEPIAEDGDYFGTAVQLAARICDRAEPGQVLVSRVVADLCAGKRLQFRHHSDATLKGFAEPVALYEVG